MISISSAYYLFGIDSQMKLYIKYMVSLRCKIVVKSVLDKLGLQYQSIGLGEVEMNNDITAQKQDLLKRALQGYGLELMEDHKSILIEQIKKCHRRNGALSG